VSRTGASAPAPGLLRQHRGFCASKRRYYYGLKGHLLVTATGQPVEFVLTPAATADIVGFRKLDLDLPAGATVTADAAYTDYDYEDLLREQEQVDLLADRKCNSKRPHPAYLGYLCHSYRKRIETTFSTVTQWLGRRLHAVTPEGWERKIFLTVIAYAILS
jgi:IS5 family transposase